MTRISHQEMCEIEHCLDRITPGMWQVTARHRLFIESQTAEDFKPIAQVNRIADADFIAAARRAVPLLIQEVRLLERALQHERRRPLIERIAERLRFWKKED